MAVTLIVEDGFGDAASNSYETLDEFKQYWLNRNVDLSEDNEDDALSSALIVAAQYLDFHYRWEGDRYNSHQAMSWPRVLFFDVDFRAMYANIIPQRVKDAQSELAKEALSGALLPTLDRGGRIQSESIGPLAVTYFADALSGKSFPLVDTILADLIFGVTSGGLQAQAYLS